MATERSQLAQVAANAKAAARAAKKSGWKLSLPPWAVSVMAWVVLIAVWEYFGRKSNPTLFTYPWAVAKNAVKFIENGELWTAAWPTLQIIGAGLFFAIIVAIPFGVLMGRYRFVDNWFKTYVAYLYATPSVALVPVIVLLFGIYLKAKIIIVTIFAFFPLLINTVEGVKNVDETLLEVAQSFRSPEYRTWIDVVIPSAVPFIVTGLRLAVGRALIGSILAEMYTSITGLGYMITTYANAFSPAKMFVPIVFIGLLGVTLTSGLNWMEKKFAPWKSGGH